MNSHKRKRYVLVAVKEQCNYTKSSLHIAQAFRTAVMTAEFLALPHASIGIHHMKSNHRLVSARLPLMHWLVSFLSTIYARVPSTASGEAADACVTGRHTVAICRALAVRERCCMCAYGVLVYAICTRRVCVCAHSWRCYCRLRAGWSLRAQQSGTL